MAEEKYVESLIDIASELFRFRQVFYRMARKLDMEDQNKYSSQFSWFSKKVTQALDDAGIIVLDLTNKPYDPGMAVTPLNLEDFEVDDPLIIEQMIEPVIMCKERLVKTGTVILGREKK